MSLSNWWTNSSATRDLVARYAAQRNKKTSNSLTEWTVDTQVESIHSRLCEIICHQTKSSESYLNSMQRLWEPVQPINHQLSDSFAIALARLVPRTPQTKSDLTRSSWTRLLKQQPSDSSRFSLSRSFSGTRRTGWRRLFIEWRHDDARVAAAFGGGGGRRGERSGQRPGAAAAQGPVSRRLSARPTALHALVPAAAPAGILRIRILQVRRHKKIDSVFCLPGKGHEWRALIGWRQASDQSGTVLRMLVYWIYYVILRVRRQETVSFGHLRKRHE